MLRSLALVTFLVLLAPATLAAPFAITGVGSCPSVASGITDPLAICTRAFGFNGPSWLVENGYPTGIGGENESDAGSQAAGSAVVNSDLGTSDFDIYGEKMGLTSFGIADVSGQTSWTDTVTIDSAGLTGQGGSFQASMFLTLDETLFINLGTALTTFSDVVYTMDVVVNGSGWRFFGEIGLFESQAGGLEIRDQGDPPGLFVTGDLFFVFGTSFDLDVETSIVTEASVNGPGGTASIDVVADVVWLGIDEVRRTSDGSLVASYTLTSGTGTDWAQPLPEPGFSALFAGIGALAGLSRRRARRAA